MFEGFVPATGEFLLGLTFNNDRSWFEAHRVDYESFLKRPFDALAADTVKCAEKAMPGRSLRCHIARIYRDARRLHGRGPYKDHLWFSLWDDTGSNDSTMFWFEIGAVDYGFGMGEYTASPSQMELFRRTIDENPARFERLAQYVNELGIYEIEGEEYKRPKAERNELIAPWYNRKRIGVSAFRGHDELLYSAQLPEFLAQRYAELAPVYDYFADIFRPEE